jgi:hypothetical protein
LGEVILLRRSAILFAAVAMLVVGTIAHVRAALDTTEPAGDSGLALLVLEVKDCTTCDLVRRYIEPAWSRSTQSRDVPLRFLDLNAVDETTIGLSTPVTIVPTIVLMRDGREVSRIVGYTGPSTFFQAVEYMLALVP